MDKLGIIKIILIYSLLLFQSILIIDCCRVPEGTIADKSPADGRYVVGIGGNPQNYEPGQRYNVSLMGIQAIQPQMHTFIGFMLSVELDKPDTKDSPDIRSAGAFELVDYLETKFSEKCRNVVTHTNTLAKSKIQIIWIAPPPGSGCVNFRATVIQHRDVWFMNDGFLTKQFCEEQQDDVDNQPPVLERCCACNEAKYELTFEGKWSRHTHPKDFPADNWSTKFSDIIGASHTVGYTFWKYGELASDGVREVAEHGSTRTLESELKDQSDKIRTIIKARGISYPNLTGKTFAVFRVDSKHHLISLVSMIHPSPDWIVGVSGLELCLPNCSWVESKVHNLYPWDAGTDSGPSYNSVDQPQVPPDVIRRIKSNNPNDPRSPFYEPSGALMKPIARLHISRRRLYEKKCENMDDMDDPTECATTPWSKWSECSSECGPGIIYKTREFNNPARGLQAKCKTETRDEKKCVGQRCGGNVLTKSTSDIHRGSTHISDNVPSLHGNLDMEAPECAMTDWTPYSKCSNTCGKGVKTKTRNYINRSGRKKCESIQKKLLEINTECTGTDCGGDIDFDIDKNYDESSEANVPSPDCEYTEWSDWGPCSTTCGIGVQSRIRKSWDATVGVDNYKASDKCSDMSISEEKECFVSNCGQGPPKFCFANPIEGACRDNITSFWYYDYMSNYCALFFSGECQSNLNKFLSKSDCEKTCIQEKQENLMEIGDLRLEKLDCIVSEWYPRPCNATCGEGYQVVTRKVLRSTKYGGKPCPRKLVRIDKCYVRCANEFYSESFNRRNSAYQQKFLNTQNKSTEAPDVNGCRYGAWSNWSPCLPNCGENSIRQKTRIAFTNANVKCRDRIRIEKCPPRPCS